MKKKLVFKNSSALPRGGRQLQALGSLTPCTSLFIFASSLIAKCLCGSDDESLFILDCLGEHLATEILAALESCGVPLEYCAGQAYDGASNMSGVSSGCAQHITSINPKVVYTHCKFHLLNLALVKACTSITEISKCNIQGTLCIHSIVHTYP